MKNPITQPLSSTPTRHVAIVIDLKYALPWHQDCYQGIMQYGQRHGWRCSLDMYASGVTGDLSTSPYDGVIGRISDEVAERAEALGVPMVNLRLYAAPNYETRFRHLPGVYTDRDAAIRLAVEHLSLTGYPRLAALAILADDEQRVYECVNTAGVEQRMQLLESFTFPGTYSDTLEQHVATLQALSRWLDGLAKPVGLMVIHPMLARIVAHVCLEQDLNVPGDVGIITPVGERLQTLSPSPTISAVEFDHYEQGYEAAALLETLMGGEPADPLQKWLAPVRLVVRESTDVFICEDELVSQAMRYIAGHVREELTVPTVAKAMGVCRSTLHRRFENELGRPPQHEINRLRTDYLKRLLSETDRSIAAISDATGFSTPSHFTRFFKRVAGETPSAYRDKHQARQQQETRLAASKPKKSRRSVSEMS